MTIPFQKFGGPDDWYLTFGVRNLFDEDYIDTARHWYECFAGDPRTFEIGIRGKLKNDIIPYMNKLVEWFIAGGPVMWPILVLSILGLAILVWKAFEFKAGRRNAKGMVVVSTIITAEPMLGILGTVTGIMQTFRSLNGADGIVNPMGATAGIGEALITTAAGLIASLILLFPYNVLDSKCSDED